MATIPQISMFVWENDLENLGDLKRLDLVLEKYITYALLC